MYPDTVYGLCEFADIYVDCQSVGITIRYHHLESAITFFDALSLVPVSSSILQITMRELVKIRPLY